MLPEPCHHAPAHRASRVLQGLCGPQYHRLALWAWCRWWGTAGPIEQALVLLLGLVHHGGAWRTVVTIGLRTLRIEPCLLSFPLLPQAELCTQDVSKGVWRRL